MTTLTKQVRLQPMSHTLRSTGTNKILAYLGQIAISPPGSNSGEDALTALNRKLESTGVLSTGSADPVFAHETALFYHNTTANRLFIRGTSTYTEISADQNTGRIEIVYTATVNPNSPNVSWSYQTGTFRVNTTPDNWSQNRRIGARWYILIICPGDSNTVTMLNRQRIDGWLADDIGYTPENSASTFLPSSVDNVEEALDGLDAQVKTLTDRPIGSSSHQNPQAIDWTATTGWRIINKPSIPPFYETEITNPSGALSQTGDTVASTITLPADLITFRSRYDAALSIEAYAQVELQATVGNPSNFEYLIEIVDASDTALSPPIISSSVELTSSANEESGYFRVFGNLPSSFTTGKIRARQTSGSGLFAGVEYFRIAIRPDVKADEIIVDRTDLGKNLKDDATDSIEDMNDVVGQVNSLPIQPTEFGTLPDFTITAGPSTPRSFVLPVPRLIQELNARHGHEIRLTVTYNSLVVENSGAPGPRINAANWNVQILRNSAGANVLTTGHTFSNQFLSAGTVRKTHTWTLTADTTNSQIIFTIPLVNDADIRITGFEYSYQELLASEVTSLAGTNITIDASTFDGNLATTDNTAQKVAQKVDDLALATTAASTTVDTTLFSDPANFGGGIRPGPEESWLNANPNNVQLALNNVDVRLQNAWNPYELTENLDRPSGATVTETFAVSSTTATLDSNVIEIPGQQKRLSQDLVIRCHAYVDSIDAAFRGNIQVIDNSGNRVGDIQLVNGTGSVVARYEARDEIDFQIRITAAAAATTDNIKVRFTRTAGAASFSRGYVHIVPATGIASAGPRGTTEQYNETIIYVAGLTLNARITATSDTNALNLLAGHTFTAYNLLLFHLDTGSDAGAIMPTMITATDFYLNNGLGMLDIKGGYWILIKRASNSSFYFRWNGNGSVGLRRVIGIKTAA